MTDVAECLSRDELEDALSAAASQVKAFPKDTAPRQTLAELAIVAEDLERAETHLKIAATLDLTGAVGLQLMRSYLRGMHARQKWFTCGALPSFPNGPTTADQHAVKLQIALRNGETDAAKAALAALEEARPILSGAWNTNEVSDVRDLDDRFQHALEAVTSGGSYLWIDLSMIAQITFERPSRALDLAWRKARVTLHDGSAADVLVPTIYPGADAADLMLGRRTDWMETHGGVVIGLGQRAMLAGNEMHGLLDAEEIRLDSIEGDHG